MFIIETCCYFGGFWRNPSINQPTNGKKNISNMSNIINLLTDLLRFLIIIAYINGKRTSTVEMALFCTGWSVFRRVDGPPLGIRLSGVLHQPTNQPTNCVFFYPRASTLFSGKVFICVCIYTCICIVIIIVIITISIVITIIIVVIIIIVIVVILIIMINITIIYCCYNINIPKLWINYSYCQWPFQDPRLEVPTIYKAYIRPM